MEMHQHHEDLFKSFHEHLKPILSTSDQAVYLYMDDANKACNRKFSSLLGYKSPAEWAKMQEPLLDIHVDEGSQDLLADTYRNSMERMTGSAINVTWKKLSGEMVSTKVILVPVSFKGHLFALHFVSRT